MLGPLVAFAFPLTLAIGVAYAAAPGTSIPPASPAFVVPANTHVVALNQVGFETAAPKRFTAPVSPDGTTFTIQRTDSDRALFSGQVHRQIGDFSEFRPADADAEYVVVVNGGGLGAGRSDPFAIRRNLYQEQFWRAAVDFMIDCRSVLGTHPSAYGGCPWRDGTYYDFAVPSLVQLFLADPAFHQTLPRQIDWAADKARVLAPSFRFDANNPHSEGVMDAVRRYFTEIEPPAADAPDVVKLIHWGLGFYLVNPSTRDPSGDPLPRQIHGQTVEQFAFLVAAWPQFERWLPRSFYERCRDFAFANWRSSGLLGIPELWHPKTYLEVSALEGDNPTGGFLHPFKGRHAPGHAIEPNLLMHAVARREKRPDADDYLTAAKTQAQWIIDQLDWNDSRTTKGHRMSEHKTIPGLVRLLGEHRSAAPAGLREKIVTWAKVATARSENLWDFRRFDDSHWTIPKLNEPGNLPAFAASALAAARVVDDPALAARLRTLATAQLDNLFGRNPQLAAAAAYPTQGFPLVERGWPVHFKPDTCARIETTRGAICASPGSEKYPFTPEGKFRHAEGWVNFNAAWNVALAAWHSAR